MIGGGGSSRHVFTCRCRDPSKVLGDGHFVCRRGAEASGSLGQVTFGCVGCYLGVVPANHLTIPRTDSMRRLSIVLVIPMLTMLIGCAARLTQAGAMIREHNDPAIREQCEFLGVVDATEKSGWDHADDRRGAMNQIRNLVAELGGDTFFVVSFDTDTMGAYAQAEAYRCNVGGFASRHGLEVRSSALRPRRGH